MCMYHVELRKNPEMDSMHDALGCESPDPSHTAGFDEIDGPDYTATKGLFDGAFYCVVIEQPEQSNGGGLSSLRRKDGIVLTDIGGNAYRLHGPGVYTMNTIKGEATLVEVSDFKAYPARVQEFIKEAEQGVVDNGGQAR